MSDATSTPQIDSDVAAHIEQVGDDLVQDARAVTRGVPLLLAGGLAMGYVCIRNRLERGRRSLTTADAR